MKFQVNIDAEVADHDADLMSQFPQAILDRFAGTAIRITDINVNKREA